MDSNPQREMELLPVTVESSGVFFCFVFVWGFLQGETLNLKSTSHVSPLSFFFFFLKLGLLAVFCNNIFNQCPLFLSVI